MTGEKLTDKQEQFCQEYLIDFNATRAAIRAGYSEKTAKDIACENLAKPYLKERITKLKQERIIRTQITQDRVLQEYASLAYFDIRKLFNDDCSLKKLSELDDETAAAIIGMEIDEIGLGDTVIGTTKKVKIADKKGSLDSLARHLGMFDDKLNLKGSIENKHTISDEDRILLERMGIKVDD